MSDVQLRVKRIRGMQRRLIDEIKAIQDACTHENKTGIYEGDTGNFCKQDDRYWIDVHCQDCDKVWTIDSVADEKEYINFDGKMV